MEKECYSIMRKIPSAQDGNFSASNIKNLDPSIKETKHRMANLIVSSM